jgi:hypothetical protein
MRTSTAKRHLGFSALLTKRPSSCYLVLPGTNGLTLSPLADQDSFLDLSPRSDRETGKEDRSH